jgi:hypothetical protein
MGLYDEFLELEMPQETYNGNVIMKETKKYLQKSKNGLNFLKQIQISEQPFLRHLHMSEEFFTEKVINNFY